jgi:ribosomal protein S18 acetylase RimI-like enzyme
MSLRKRPMTAAEFEDWRAASTATYAQEIEQALRLSPEQAAAKAASSFAHLLPQGVDTPNHSIYVFEEEGDGTPVGQLWIAEERVDGRARLYVYRLDITQAERGRGFGREAMLIVEAEARARGLDRIELNVWPSNRVAHALYRSLEFEETSLGMVKLLGE